MDESSLLCVCVSVLDLSLIAVVDENCCGFSVTSVVMLPKFAIVDGSVVFIVSFVIGVVDILFTQLSSCGSQSIFRL